MFADYEMKERHVATGLICGEYHRPVSLTSICLIRLSAASERGFNMQFPSDFGCLRVFQYISDQQ